MAGAIRVSTETSNISNNRNGLGTTGDVPLTGSPRDPPFTRSL